MTSQFTENNTSPIWLPQINDNYVDELLEELKNMGIIVKKLMISPKHLIPQQSKVQKTKIDNFNNLVDKDEYLPQTWVDADNNILDGHHRVYTYQSRPDIDKVECYKIYLNTNDACRIINKLQDRMDFKKEFNINDDKYKISDYKSFMEQPISNDEEEEIDSFKDKKENKEKDLDEWSDKSGESLNFDELGNKVFKLYSSKKINPKAPTGNILSFNEGEGFTNVYELQFDNILEIPSQECDLYDPIYLAAVYHLKQDFEQKPESIKKAASTAGMNLAEFTKSKANQFAKMNKYDGINFGGKFMLAVTQ